MKKFLKHFDLGLLTLIVVFLFYGSIVYSPTYVYRVLVWQDSDAFDWQKFPNHPLSASSTPYHFTSSLDPRVEELLTQLSGADDTVTNFLQTRIWDPLGMEFDGSWFTDSKESDFEKMETGVNARAIDFAKFGVLYLNGGNWNGTQVLSKTWIEESTQPLLPENYDDYYTDYVKAMPGQGYYNYMWWGMVREDGSYDFTAAGDKGQFIYVSPESNMVIVRNGVKYGIDSHEWLKLFYEFVDQY